MQMQMQMQILTTHLLHLRFLLQRKRIRRRRCSSSINSYALLRALKPLSPPTTNHKYNNPAPSSSASAITHTTHTAHATILHSLIITLGFQSIIPLQTALINLYSASAHIHHAQHLFDEISHPNLVAWTDALISAYLNNHKPNIALHLFTKMHLQNLQPDLIAFTVALSASARLAALHAGEWIHACIRKQGLDQDLILTNALINMYCKCGDIRAAYHLFQMSNQRDVTTWTSIIVGCALHGRADEALQLFETMKTTSSNCNPNSVTFLALLTACSHAGLVEQGKQQWDTMRIYYKLKPSMAHYGCMVDLLCRAGHLEEAYEFIEKMPVEPNAVIWRTLLGACSLKGNVGLGNLARKRLLELDPESVNDGVSMSNAYAKLGMWEEKEQVRRRRVKGRRPPGSSTLIAPINSFEFVAGDRSKGTDEERQLASN